MIDAELMGPNSTYALEEMRGEPFIPGCPDAECKLLDYLHGELVEGYLSEADEGAPQRKEGCEFMEEEGYGDEVPNGTPMHAGDDVKSELTKTQ